jgi:hypothetical protein
VRVIGHLRLVTSRGGWLAFVMLVGEGCSALPSSDWGVARENLGAMEHYVIARRQATDGREFWALGPFPGANPWKSPVRTPGWSPPEAQLLEFKPARDGLLKERYESGRCAGRFMWDCVEVLVTGVFDGRLSCFGSRIEKRGREIIKTPIPLRQAGLCPNLRPPSAEEEAMRRREREARRIRDQMREELRKLPL